jgi:hypothetical protein
MVRLKLPPLGSDRGGRVEALNPGQGPRLQKSGPLSTVEVRTIGTVISHHSYRSKRYERVRNATGLGRKYSYLLHREVKKFHYNGLLNIKIIKNTTT